MQFRHIVDAENNLEGTYIIRLFAEFETGLRSYFDTLRDTNPPARDLLNSLAALCGIPEEQRENAHLVWEYRNSLVHEREDEVEPISIPIARGYLAHFFKFLPCEW